MLRKFKKIRKFLFIKVKKIYHRQSFCFAWENGETAHTKSSYTAHLLPFFVRVRVYMYVQFFAFSSWHTHKNFCTIRFFDVLVTTHFHIMCTYDKYLRIYVYRIFLQHKNIVSVFNNNNNHHRNFVYTEVNNHLSSQKPHLSLY